MDWDVIRVLLALRFQGWTLEYIDSLSTLDAMSVMAVLHGKATADAG
jgi:hypothetical protein